MTRWQLAHGGLSVKMRKVPEASGQDQHPVKKGDTEGELVIGRVK